MRALDLEVLLRIQELSGETARTMFFTEEHLAVRLSSFHGIELEEWPAQIAATALHLVEHQANQAMELALGSAPDPLPLDKIKIDNSFVQDLIDDGDDATIVRAIIQLGKSLGMQVIAEGVETVEQEAYVIAEGCHEGQGYLYSKPLGARELVAYLKQAKRNKAVIL